MKSKEQWIGFGLLFVGLVIYSMFLRQNMESLSHDLETQKLVRQGREDMRFSLQTDVERVNKLTSDITTELGNEEKTFEILQESLQNIDAKLQGAEELGAAVAELRQECDSLKLEILRRTELKR